MQYVGFDVAARVCNDFGEWRFRETFRQEDAEDVGQTMVAMCCVGFIRLLVGSLGNLSITAPRNKSVQVALSVDARSATQ